MARSVRKLPQVRADIADCATYIGRHSPSAAERFIQAAENCFSQLAQSPYLGTFGEFESQHMVDIYRWRIKGFENYLVFYRVTDNAVEIVRVIHGARDIPAEFEANPNEH